MVIEGYIRLFKVLYIYIYAKQSYLTMIFILDTFGAKQQLGFDDFITGPGKVKQK